ncbi:NACHT, LRR and PYD domains-containing protein 3 isoform X4 [Lates calcarifer]|uniref:NACHT, LRR and PYD domains-containing protein 3 isoform X4 n=1 Tax=Lates calcarifer TaxID=8187 RepID=A0AAJ8DQ07_LATCA|nr:NACHT, LRR and PYD domains-containing protein 3 isoform X4 [Lates calcarifer]
MGNWLTTVRAVDPLTSAIPQKQAGTKRVTAQNGGVIINPKFNGADVKGDVNINVNMNVQSPAKTDKTDIVSPKTKENTIQRCHTELKSYLQNKTKNLFQGTKEDGSLTPLNKIYTELYITEGGSEEVSGEHKVIESKSTRSSRSSRSTSEEKKIYLNNIFEPLSNGEIRPQRVLTKGISGIGKTVAVQKFTHDWAEGTANQNIQYIFPFTFRDLNLIKDKSLSLVDLICHYFEEVKGLETSDYKKSSILFIFDGLDESIFPLDFDNNEMCRSVTEAASVDTLLTNLIKGKLLHKALVWITSRPAAASRIPPEFINRVTEVRGFNDEQKEEYFQKKINDEVVAQKILKHLQSKPLRSLYIMCHIPLFCWISATALQSLVTGTHKNELPKTVTEMYTHFLIIQTKRKQQKDYEKGEPDKDLIMKLGKLAFEQLQEGNMIFNENDLKGCEIDLKQAAVFSGVCTQIIRKEYGLHRQECYSFIHLSVQEFLAALYVLETFIDSRKNLLPSPTKGKVALKNGEIPIVLLHKSAVDMALKSDYGQWDLFLRFLLGLSQGKNQELLQKVFGFQGTHLQSNQEIIKYINSKIKKQLNYNKITNLFHCLNELGDQTLVEQVQTYQSSGDVSKISPSHWSALAFVLLFSNEDLDVFDLKKYHRSDEVLERLVPVLKAAKKALLSDCNLTPGCCGHISSVLSLESSALEELDLSRNKLQDSGVELLSDGLKSPNCKLQRLRLISCGLSERSCEALASVLSSQSSTLKELDLSNNNLQDSGVKLLLASLKSPHCTLETLRLSGCQVTVEGCSSLASALRSNPSHLKELDLRYNHPGDSGVKLLSALKEDPQYSLETPRLEHGGKQRLKPGLRKYACELTLDTNTAHKNLQLTDSNRRVTPVRERQPYPYHPERERERFEHWRQLLCEDAVTDHGYWEVEWKGKVNIAVTYRGIKRKGCSFDSRFGETHQSWSLSCSDVDSYTVSHNKERTYLPRCSVSNRVGVYVDCPAGRLSFYRVSSDSLIHLHTFKTTFTEPLYPGFWVGSGSSVSLCSL